MNLILNTHATNEFADGFSYALVSITPELAEHIIHRFEIAKIVEAKCPDIAELEFHDYAPMWLSRLPDNEDGDETEIDSGQPYTIATLPVEAYERFKEERTECDRMVIDVGTDEVYWTCYPKHCDWKVETRPIEIEKIRIQPIQ